MYHLAGYIGSFSRSIDGSCQIHTLYHQLGWPISGMLLSKISTIYEQEIISTDSGDGSLPVEPHEVSGTSTKYFGRG